MQGKRQCRCVVWIINWALEIHCNARVPLGANKLVSEDWTKRNPRWLQRTCGIWYLFFVYWVKVLLDFLKLSNFVSLYSIVPKKKIIFFISNNEKWLNLKKNFSKVYHHSKCFGWYYRSNVFSTTITILKAWL